MEHIDHELAMDILTENEPKINAEIKKDGIIKPKIEDGDYGYYLHNGKHKPRLFLAREAPNPTIIQSFCICERHCLAVNLKTGLMEGGFGHDVNKSRESYRILGNLRNFTNN